MKITIKRINIFFLTHGIMFSIHQTFNLKLNLYMKNRKKRQIAMGVDWTDQNISEDEGVKQIKWSGEGCKMDFLLDLMKPICYHKCW